ncbi:MAG: TlpA disulfide reductase family protein [Dehalococcoidia bacterium]|nr:TlpA disulfide reductase family protein [Dehalococcoidia bacterium]
MRIHRIHSLFAVIAIASLLVASCVPAEGAAGEAGSLPEAPKVGFLAPDFLLQSLDGRTVRMSDYRGSKPVLLNFWATWCGPCQIEMPHMQKAWQTVGGRDKVEMLMVDVGETPEKAKGFLSRYGYTFTAVVDGDQSVSGGKYNVFGLPTTFLIDRKGVIRSMKIGPFVSEEDVVAQLQAIINF